MNQINIEIVTKLAQREVLCNCSYLMRHFLMNPEALKNSSYLYEDLLDQLTVYDWEQAARDEGWIPVEKQESKPAWACDLKEPQLLEALADGFVHLEDGVFVESSPEETWQGLCEENRIEPYEQEVMEYWIVTGWLAEQLQQAAAPVTELLDLQIWGRCETGQSLGLDSQLRRVAAKMEILQGQRYSWESQVCLP